MAIGYSVKEGGRPYSVDEKITTRADFYNGTTNTNDLFFDPLITGYSIIIFTRFPTWVRSVYPDAPILLQKNFAGFDGNNDMELGTADVQEGFSQNAYQIAQNIGAKPNNFSLKHLEYSGSIIGQIYTLWVTGIRDPDTGIATYPQRFGLDYAAFNHTAELMYISLRPDANNIERPIVEFASYWTACFPKKIPISHFNYTKASQTAPIEIDMPWSGVMHIGPGVDQAAYALLKANAGGRSFNFATAADFASEGAGKANVLNGYTGAAHIGEGDNGSEQYNVGHPDAQFGSRPSVGGYESIVNTGKGDRSNREWSTTSPSIMQDTMPVPS